MADISTAVSMARVPILGENGRISDDYIPAAIGENVTKAESAATRAESAKTDAETAKEAAETAKTAAQSAKTAAETAQKGAESAKTAAETAKTAAEKAKADAESAGTAAENSASKAQQSATAAAESAASVADKFIASAQATTLEPGSQATASVENQVLTIGVPKGEKGDQGDKGDTGTGVPDGGTPGQLLSKTEDGTAWVDPPSGNVLKGTLGPAPLLSADDAYATKPRRLTVYGETRQNLWVNPQGTANGVTVTDNDDGSFTIGGTLVGSEAGLRSPKNIYTLKPSTQYTLSIDKPIASSYTIGSSGACVYVHTLKSDGSYLVDYIVGYGSNLSVSFTTGPELSCCVACINIFSNDFNSGTYRVMLNEGPTAQPWCPPGLNSVDELSVVTAGKNLFNAKESIGEVSGWTKTQLSDAGDGWIKATVSSGALGINYNSDKFRFLADTTYTLSLEAYANKDIRLNYNFIMQSGNVDNTGLSSLGATDPLVTTAKQRVYITFRTKKELVGNIMVGIRGGFGVDDELYVRNLQLELGSTATAYEPPNVTTTPLPEVELRSLPDGTCDELTIDATGAVTLTKRVGVFEATEDTSWTEYGVGGNANAYYTNTGMNAHSPTGDVIDAVDTKMMCDDFPCYQVVWSGTSAAPRVGMSDNRGLIDKMFYNSAGYGPAASDTRMTVLYPLAEPQTIPLPAVTLPTLPAPTVNVYADAESSVTGYAMGPDVGMEYERDVNIAFDKLQAQVSATTVREATNG